MHGSAIIQSSRSDNERKCKYIIESEKCKRAAFTLPTCTGKGTEIWWHSLDRELHMVSRLPNPMPVPKRHDFGSNVTILAATSLTLTSTFTADYVIVLSLNFVLFLLDTITYTLGNLSSALEHPYDVTPLSFQYFHMNFVL